MVSFSCEVCNDTVVKKKLMQHRGQCYGAYFTCLDCQTTFQGTDFQSHTSCISEAEKYQKSLYKPKKANKNSSQSSNGQIGNNTGKAIINEPVVTDASEPVKTDKLSDKPDSENDTQNQEQVIEPSISSIPASSEPASKKSSKRKRDNAGQPAEQDEGKKSKHEKLVESNNSSESDDKLTDIIASVAQKKGGKVALKNLFKVLKRGKETKHISKSELLRRILITNIDGKLIIELGSKDLA
ncbi:hypothetical protein V1514DRAFT_366067 [Lipomyces japonicus]|uniref:uncharacterized protein n=1 Tax=Lipomyces japonicus TaxID=56871 RepID=UPI0034D01C95